MSEPATILRFDVFELDTGSGELRRKGDRVKLPPQPFRVLELLVRRGGEVLTRADIRERIWCDSFVDFEQGLNFCIRQIREALGDTADAPRFIETLPRRGYRFLVPVETPPAMEPKSIRSLIVTGTLLSTGDEIRVTAQLTDAATGTLMCSHSTQTSIGHVFRLQDELTERMVEALSVQLTSREQRILRHDVPADPKAYEYYLRGNQF